VRAAYSPAAQFHWDLASHEAEPGRSPHFDPHECEVVCRTQPWPSPSAGLPSPKAAIDEWEDLYLELRFAGIGSCSPRCSGRAPSARSASSSGYADPRGGWWHTRDLGVYGRRNPAPHARRGVVNAVAHEQSRRPFGSNPFTRA
jgi:hypothetical protein